VIGQYVDVQSGDSDPFRREQGAKLLDLDPEGIVIFSMDRLRRQHPVKVIQLIEQLKDRGIKVISIAEPAFNMESEFGEIMLYLIGWFNNYFLKKLKRDIKAGMDKARAQGKHIGRRAIEFNKFRAYHLLVTEKKSLRVVAAELGVSAPTIMRFKREFEKDPTT
jgi:DNA invertase Pin-like site-specific DNA recombinase